MFEYYQAFFDVDTYQVLDRIHGAIYWRQIQKANSDSSSNMCQNYFKSLESFLFRVT